jgi:N-acetylmuramoyl-L-alanine amidase
MNDIWLVPEVDRVETLALGRHVLPIECVVYHYTASPQGRGPNGSDLGRIRRWLGDPEPRSSTHFVILRSGVVVQGAPLDERTWHAGKSAWNGRANVNGFSLGVDLENVGRLENARGEWFDAYGREFHDTPLVDPKQPARFAWEPYTPHQIDALCWLVDRLCRRFPSLLNVDAHVGHEDIAVPAGRKLDPGPAFPWGEVRDTVENAAREMVCG